MNTYYLKYNNKMLLIKRESLCDVIDFAKLKYEEWEVFSSEFKKLAYSSILPTIGILKWKSTF